MQGTRAGRKPLRPALTLPPGRLRADAAAAPPPPPPPPPPIRRRSNPPDVDEDDDDAADRDEIPAENALASNAPVPMYQDGELPAP